MTIEMTDQRRDSARVDWHRIFEPLHEEHDYVVDEVEGRLPEQLVGTMYRNGPGKWEQGGAPLAHLLEGDGMVSAFALDGRSVRFRNRYVRTPAYERALGDGGLVDRTAGTLLPGGPERNAGKEVVKQANTHVVLHARRLLALYGGSAPWELDPTTLETIGIQEFDGMLGPDRPGFSAHAKLDPRTGELCNFGTQPLPEQTVHTYAVDKDGRGRRLASVTVPIADWVHDFAITRRYFVFALAPFKFDLQKIISGEASPTAALHLAEEMGTSFLLVPRDGGAPRLVEHDTFAFFHFTNAYDDGDDVVVELARFEQPWETVNQAMFDFRTGGTDYFAHRVWQYRITPSGRVISEPQLDHLSEWPQLDWRRVGDPHRYSYHATTDPVTAAGGLAKIDHQTGRSTHHALPAGHVVGEPSFVPRSATADEDDGWVLFVAYDPAEHRSRLVILDARDVEGSPVTVAHLRHHLPMAFHGSFSGAHP